MFRLFHELPRVLSCSCSSTVSASEYIRTKKDTRKLPQFGCPPRAPNPILLRVEVRGVEEDAHEHAAEGAGDGDGHDPGESQKPDTLEVDGFEGAVAQPDADGGAGDAHGGRDGQGVLGEDEHRDGGAHLHGAPAGR
nr:hypothetical protein CFP56_31790 [Quercus suber]